MCVDFTYLLTTNLLWWYFCSSMLGVLLQEDDWSYCITYTLLLPSFTVVACPRRYMLFGPVWQRRRRDVQTMSAHQERRHRRYRHTPATIKSSDTTCLPETVGNAFSKCIRFLLRTLLQSFISATRRGACKVQVQCFGCHGTSHGRSGWTGIAP
jgi:hypothetical protein